MKLFTKLALVSAVAVSGSAMAMESMDDSALSSATGQDGISIGIGISKIAIENLYIHDNDGLAAKGAVGDAGFGGTSKAGAITITGTGSTAINGGANATDGIVIGANTASLLASHNLADITIDSDAGTGVNGAFLNIGAEVSGLKIYVGKIGVAKSNAVQTTGAYRGVVDGSNNTIINGLSLTTGVTSANIQLGATPQGAMINLSGSIDKGLIIENLGIVDNANKGQITIDALTVTDAATRTTTGGVTTVTPGTKLTTNATINVKPEGLVIVGGSTATDLYVKGISLSSVEYDNGTPATLPTAWTAKGKSIGDVEVGNMRVFNGTAGTTPGAVITIRGH